MCCSHSSSLHIFIDIMSSFLSSQVDIIFQSYHCDSGYLFSSSTRKKPGPANMFFLFILKHFHSEIWFSIWKFHVLFPKLFSLCDAYYDFYNSSAIIVICLDHRGHLTMLILLAFSWKSLSYEIFRLNSLFHATEIRTLRTLFRITLKALTDVRSKERKGKGIKLLIPTLSQKLHFTI